jgi:hypothetical protein
MNRFLTFFCLSLSACASDPGNTHRVVIDYRKAFPDLIQEAAATQNFEVTLGDLSRVPQRAEASAEIEVILVDLGRKATVDEAISELRSRQLRPANLAELFALASKMKDFPASDLKVVELGTVWESHNGQKVVAYFSIGEGYRYITSIEADRTFNERWAFAAVRKQ